MAELLDRLQRALADRYAVERELGRGGMATVYLAEERHPQRHVAIKVLDPTLASVLGPERFLREVDLASKLAHPHILPIYAAAEADGLLYYVMPYVEGESLRDRLNREKQLPLDDALQIAREVADGLSYAHAHGVVHRDIKPENILLESGHAVVADFGIARAIDAAAGTRLTETGVALGTPAYMSPEQAAGSKDLDGRSDLYSLGCVLFEMLGGQAPFTGPTADSVVHQHLAVEPPSIGRLRPAVPASVAAALMRALAKTPADRFNPVAQFAEALRPVVVTTPVAVPVALRARGGRWVALAGALVVVAAISALLFQRGRARPTNLDPNVISVMPFRVTSTDTLLRELGQQLPDLLWARLTGEFGPRTTDPAFAVREWKARGGTPESPLPQAQEVEIARAVGAGRMIVGSLSGTSADLTVTGSLVEVPGASVRVPPTSVRGPYDSFPRLVDRLTNLLLAADFGDAVHRLPTLASHPTVAVQAYLRGIQAYRLGVQEDWNAARAWLRRALEMDSTMVLAALASYDAGEGNQAMAAYAWARQAELSPRDRAFLHALAGWRFGATRTEAEKIAQYDSVRQLAPDFPVLSDLAYDVHLMGAMTGMAGWRVRDRTANERAVALDSTAFLPLESLFDLALAEGDTAGARRRAAALAGLASTADTRASAWSARLRLALALGDSAQAAHLWAEGERAVAAHPDSAMIWLYSILGGLLVDARGLPALDHFVAAVRTATPLLEHYPITWARARGRYDDWQSLRDALYRNALHSYYPTIQPVVAAAFRVRDALFLGAPDDSTVRAAATFLDRVSRRVIRLPPSSSDPTPEVVGPARARCWSTLWHLAHGETDGAAKVARELGTLPLPYRWSVCAGLIDVFLTEHEGGDVHRAVLQLDSIVRPQPLEAWPQPWGVRDLTGLIDNLVLARMLTRYGEPARALAAARRGRAWETAFADMSLGLIVDYLREEGRLAATTGDTAGAVWAYEHYLALREDPELPWRAQRDSVRAELAALRGRK